MSAKSFLLFALVTLCTLFFWTLTSNFFATPKEVFFSIVITVICFIGIHHLFLKKTLKLPSISTAVPLLFFFVTVVLSLIFNPEGRPEALGSKASILLALPIISLFFNFQFSVSLYRVLTNSLITVGSILSIHSLLSLTFLHRMVWMPPYMQTQVFTPTGSYLTTLFLIITSLAISVFLLKKNTHKIYFKICLLLLHIVALVAIVAQMLPGNPLAPVLLPYSSSWSIALDALKSLRSLLFGIGISNYSLLYTSVRPININATELFNLLPQSATSEILTLLPTAGLLTTLSLIYLMMKSVYLSRSSILFAPMIITAISFFIIPASLIHYLLLFMIYGLVSRIPDDKHINLSNNLNVIISLLILVLSLGFLYPTTSNYVSEYFINQAKVAINSGESQKAYESHLRALTFSPNTSSYYVSFADINFRLALALSQKPNLSDEDRQNISKLIQQSIESCKKAISLRPNDSRSWIALAKIYQNLISVAQGADNFALEAYVKAVSLDRANPELRVELGNLFAQLSTLPKNASSSSILRDRALTEITTSLQLKNDFAAAYYSLAKIYSQNNQPEKARTAYELALKNLDVNSPEYSKIQSEINELTTSQSQLPSPTPSPVTMPNQ